jgi:hypothetical protein
MKMTTAADIIMARRAVGKLEGSSTLFMIRGGILVNVVLVADIVLLDETILTLKI